QRLSLCRKYLNDRVSRWKIETQLVAYVNCDRMLRICEVIEHYAGLICGSPIRTGDCCSGLPCCTQTAFDDVNSPGTNYCRIGPTAEAYDNIANRPDSCCTTRDE